MRKFESILKRNFGKLVIATILMMSFLGLQNRPKDSSSFQRNIVASDSSYSSFAKLDGDELYKQNCSRCHQPPGKFEKSKYMTIMKHMRTIANFTEDEEKALLQYLTK